MKFIFIMYNSALEEEVTEMLSEAGLENHTKWTHVLGKGTSGGPRLDSHIWPGFNNVVAVAAQDLQSQTLISKLQRFKESLNEGGIKAMVLPLDTLV